MLDWANGPKFVLHWLLQLYTTFKHSWLGFYVHALLPIILDFHWSCKCISSQPWLELNCTKGFAIVKKHFICGRPFGVIQAYDELCLSVFLCYLVLSCDHTLPLHSLALCVNPIFSQPKNACWFFLVSSITAVSSSSRSFVVLLWSMAIPD